MADRGLAKIEGSKNTGVAVRAFGETAGKYAGPEA
jgi:hypothetical protein